MLKFLFRGKKEEPIVEIEADRARFNRLIGELNEMIDSLGVKPRVTVDPATGHVELATPEQFADEALALPPPTAEELDDTANSGPEAEAEPEEAEAAQPELAPAAEAPKPVPQPPVPNPPKPNQPEGR